MAIGPSLTSPSGHSAWDYMDTVLAYLVGIKEAVEDGQGSDPVYRRIPFNFDCDASGNGIYEIEIPRGVNVDLLGIAFTGSNVGNVITYANEASPFTMLKVNSSATFVSDDYVDTTLTSDERKVVIVAAGQLASTKITGNLRIRQYEANGNPLPVR